MAEEQQSVAQEADAEAEVAVPEKFQAIVEQLEKMSVLDLAELVKILEKKFGVSAAMPMMMGAMPSGGAAAGEPVEEKTMFTVELTASGANKIAVIKAVRELTQLGLKEAKDLVDKAPSVVAENVKKEDAEAMKAKLLEAGGSVNLK